MKLFTLTVVLLLNLNNSSAQLKDIDSSNFNFKVPQVGNYIIFRDISSCRISYITKADKDKVLFYLVQLLKDSNFILRIENHTDCRASEDFNLQLSNRISNTYKRFFLLKGVDSSRIKAVGMGSSKLFLEKCNCNNEEANTNCLDIEHLLNRRTVFKITGKKEE